MLGIRCGSQILTQLWLLLMDVIVKLEADLVANRPKVVGDHMILSAYPN